MALIGTEGDLSGVDLSGVNFEKQYQHFVMNKFGTESNRIVWHSKKGFLPEQEAMISIYDSALMFGDMVFEMTRSFNRKHFKLAEHIDRLFRSAKFYKINPGISKEKLTEAIDWTCKVNEDTLNPDDEWRLMINITRGIMPAYLKAGLKENAGTNIIIAAFPLRWSVQGLGKDFAGVSSFVSSQRTISEQFVDPKVKNRARVHYKFAYLEAAERGKNEWPIMMDEDGNIAEGPGYNFFIIKNNKVISPKGRNILRGISRSYIKELCETYDIRKRLEFKTKNFGIYDIVNADGAFVTGTPFCMLPVVSIDGTLIGDGKRCGVFDYLLQKWSCNVDVDIAEQIRKWDSK